MPSYWSNKWAKAHENWELLQARGDQSEEVLQGLEPSGRRQYGLKVPPGSRDYHQLFKTGNVGREASLNLGIGSAEIITLLDVRGPDEYAQIVTVTLDFPALEGVGVSPPTPENPFVAVGDGARAVVDFGVGGFQSTAFVDFVRGVSFSVPGSFIRVSATRAGTTGALVRLSVGAHISYLPISQENASQPSLTFVRSAIIVAGATADIIPPPFSVTITPFFQDAAAGIPPPAGSSIGLQFFSRSGAFLGACRSRAENPNPIPIPAETRCFHS